MVEPHASSSSDGPNWRSLELAKVQFIQQQFADLLDLPDSPPAGGGMERIYWIHDRLFNDGWSVESVRAALAPAAGKLRVIAVTSGKGGVGKTTVAVNLAFAFGRDGKRTLVFDGDLGLANVHVFSGVNPRSSILEVIDRRARLNEVVTRGPHGVDFICGASGVSRLAELEPRALDELGRALMQLAQGYDVLLIDTGAGIGSATLSLLSQADEIVIISTPNLAATLDAYGMIKCIHERKMRAQLHLLVNLADEERSAEAVFTRIAGCAQQFLQRSVARLGVFVRDGIFEASNQARTPLVQQQPEHMLARRFTAMTSVLSRASEASAPEPAPSAPSTFPDASASNRQTLAAHESAN